MRRVLPLLLVLVAFSCNPPLTGAPCLSHDNCPQDQFCTPTGICEINTDCDIRCDTASAGDSFCSSDTDYITCGFGGSISCLTVVGTYSCPATSPTCVVGVGCQ